MAEGQRVPVVEKVMSANEQVAARNRAALQANKIVTVNIMSSPGAGKTTLLLATIRGLREKARLGVIEGDIASQVDADKIAAVGIPVVQINTGGECHLDARMVEQSLPALPLADLDLLFVENVGNLICPVGFDLGQNYDVALLSVPEGHDKPYKYPGIFEAVSLVVVTKTDLMPYMDFDLAEFKKLVNGLNPKAEIITLSAKTGEGMADWIRWLEARLPIK